jgi:hypothetical protein
MPKDTKTPRGPLPAELKAVRTASHSKEFTTWAKVVKDNATIFLKYPQRLPEAVNNAVKDSATPTKQQLHEAGVALSKQWPKRGKEPKKSGRRASKAPQMATRVVGGNPTKADEWFPEEISAFVKLYVSSLGSFAQMCV